MGGAHLHTYVHNAFADLSVCQKNICNSFIFLATPRHAGGAASSIGVMSGEGSGLGADLVPDPELFIHYTRSTDEPFITADYGGGRQPIT